MSQSEATLLLRVKEVGQAILDKFVITLGDVIDIAKSVASAIYSTVEAYREKELAINELTQSMMNQGVFTGELRAKYMQMAEALQDLTTYGNEQILSAQGILQSFVGQKEVSEELVKATLDLATAKKMDLASAANLVGKAIANDTDVLGRYGIKVKEATDESQKMANVIAAVNQKFEGQSQVAAKGLGVIDQLKQNWGDFLANVGQLMTPFVTGLASAANAALKLTNALMPQHFDAAKSSVDGINQEVLKLRREIIKIQEGAAMRGSPLDGFENAMIQKLEKQIVAHKEAQAIMLADQRASAETATQIERDKAADRAAIALEDQIKKQDEIRADHEMQFMSDEERYNAYLAQIDRKLQADMSYAERKQLIQDRADMIDLINTTVAGNKKLEKQKELDKKREEDQKATLNTIATLQNSHNGFLAAIGKAAAITQIAIETPVAIARALAAFPPPFNFAAAGLVGTAMAAQAARIAGVQLAEGGVVRATPGGVPAIIGEGGRDEAVIPLEDGRIPGSGGVTVNINGPFMGNEENARALAKIIDEQLFNMRRNNESLSFDSGVI